MKMTIEEWVVFISFTITINIVMQVLAWKVAYRLATKSNREERRRMSNALKCDRCGKLYEAYDGIQIVDGGYRYCRMALSGYTVIPYEKTYDLCEECMKSLVEWIKEAENESDSDNNNSDHM